MVYSNSSRDGGRKLSRSKRHDRKKKHLCFEREVKGAKKKKIYGRECVFSRTSSMKFRGLEVTARGSEDGYLKKNRCKFGKGC